MSTMLVTQGLNELKLLDERIKKEIDSLEAVAVAKKSNTNITTNLSKADFCKNEKAKMQSVLDLIERRSKIKSAIVHSNAVTNVTIAGKTYTVAEAIERKNSIIYEELLTRQLNAKCRNAEMDVTHKNNEVETQIVAMVNNYYGKDSKVKISDDDYTSLANPYREKNEFELVDPLNARETAKDINDRVQEFLSEVDSALQISNCTTTIEI